MGRSDEHLKPSIQKLDKVQGRIQEVLHHYKLAGVDNSKEVTLNTEFGGLLSGVSGIGDAFFIAVKKKYGPEGESHDDTLFAIAKSIEDQWGVFCNKNQTKKWIAEDASRKQKAWEAFKKRYCLSQEDINDLPEKPFEAHWKDGDSEPKLLQDKLHALLGVSDPSASKKITLGDLHKLANSLYLRDTKLEECKTKLNCPTTPPKDVKDWLEAPIGDERVETILKERGVAIEGLSIDQYKKQYGSWAISDTKKAIERGIDQSRDIKKSGPSYTLWAEKIDENILYPANHVSDYVKAELLCLFDNDEAEIDAYCNNLNNPGRYYPLQALGLCDENHYHNMNDEQAAIACEVFIVRYVEQKQLKQKSSSKCLSFSKGKTPDLELPQDSNLKDLLESMPEYKHLGKQLTEKIGKIKSPKLKRSLSNFYNAQEKSRINTAKEDLEKSINEETNPAAAQEAQDVKWQIINLRNSIAERYIRIARQKAQHPNQKVTFPPIPKDLKGIQRSYPLTLETVSAQRGGRGGPDRTLEVGGAPAPAPSTAAPAPALTGAADGTALAELADAGHSGCKIDTFREQAAVLVSQIKEGSQGMNDKRVKTPTEQLSDEARKKVGWVPSKKDGAPNPLLPDIDFSDLLTRLEGVANNIEYSDRVRQKAMTSIKGIQQVVALSADDPTIYNPDFLVFLSRASIENVETCLDELYGSGSNFKERLQEIVNALEKGVITLTPGAVSLITNSLIYKTENLFVTSDPNDNKQLQANELLNGIQDIKDLTYPHAQHLPFEMRSILFPQLIAGSLSMYSRDTTNAFLQDALGDPGLGEKSTKEQIKANLAKAQEFLNAYDTLVFSFKNRGSFEGFKQRYHELFTPEKKTWIMRGLASCCGSGAKEDPEKQDREAFFSELYNVVYDRKQDSKGQKLTKKQLFIQNNPWLLACEPKIATLAIKLLKDFDIETQEFTLADVDFAEDTLPTLFTECDGSGLMNGKLQELWKNRSTCDPFTGDEKREYQGKNQQEVITKLNTNQKITELLDSLDTICNDGSALQGPVADLREAVDASPKDYNTIRTAVVALQNALDGRKNQTGIAEVRQTLCEYEERLFVLQKSMNTGVAGDITTPNIDWKDDAFSNALREHKKAQFVKKLPNFVKEFFEKALESVVKNVGLQKDLLPVMQSYLNPHSPCTSIASEHGGVELTSAARFLTSYEPSTGWAAGGGSPEETLVKSPPTPSDTGTGPAKRTDKGFLQEILEYIGDDNPDFKGMTIFSDGFVLMKPTRTLEEFETVLGELRQVQPFISQQSIELAPHLQAELSKSVDKVQAHVLKQKLLQAQKVAEIIEKEYSVLDFKELNLATAEAELDKAEEALTAAKQALTAAGKGDLEDVFEKSCQVRAHEIRVRMIEEYIASCETLFAKQTQLSNAGVSKGEAEEDLKAAEEDLKAAQAEVDKAQAEVDKAQAEVDAWQEDGNAVLKAAEQGVRDVQAEIDRFKFKPHIPREARMSTTMYQSLSGTNSESMDDLPDYESAAIDFQRQLDLLGITHKKMPEPGTAEAKSSCLWNLHIRSVLLSFYADHAEDILKGSRDQKDVKVIIGAWNKADPTDWCKVEYTDTSYNPCQRGQKTKQSLFELVATSNDQSLKDKFRKRLLDELLSAKAELDKYSHNHNSPQYSLAQGRIIIAGRALCALINEQELGNNFLQVGSGYEREAATFFVSLIPSIMMLDKEEESKKVLEELEAGSAEPDPESAVGSEERAAEPDPESAEQDRESAEQDRESLAKVASEERKKALASLKQHITDAVKEATKEGITWTPMGISDKPFAYLEWLSTEKAIGGEEQLQISFPVFEFSDGALNTGTLNDALVLLGIHSDPPITSANDFWSALGGNKPNLLKQIKVAFERGGGTTPEDELSLDQAVTAFAVVCSKLKDNSHFHYDVGGGNEGLKTVVKILQQIQAKEPEADSLLEKLQTFAAGTRDALLTNPTPAPVDHDRGAGVSGIDDTTPAGAVGPPPEPTPNTDVDHDGPAPASSDALPEKGLPEADVVKKILKIFYKNGTPVFPEEYQSPDKLTALVEQICTSLEPLHDNRMEQMIVAAQAGGVVLDGDKENFLNQLFLALRGEGRTESFNNDVEAMFNVISVASPLQEPMPAILDTPTPAPEGDRSALTPEGEGDGADAGALALPDGSPPPKEYTFKRHYAIRSAISKAFLDDLRYLREEGSNQSEGGKKDRADRAIIPEVRELFELMKDEEVSYRKPSMFRKLQAIKEDSQLSMAKDMMASLIVKLCRDQASFDKHDQWILARLIDKAYDHHCNGGFSWNGQVKKIMEEKLEGSEPSKADKEKCEAILECLSTWGRARVTLPSLQKNLEIVNKMAQVKNTSIRTRVGYNGSQIVGSLGGATAAVGATAVGASTLPVIAAATAAATVGAGLASRTAGEDWWGVASDAVTAGFKGGFAVSVLPSLLESWDVKDDLMPLATGIGIGGAEFITDLARSGADNADMPPEQQKSMVHRLGQAGMKGAIGCLTAGAIGAGLEVGDQHLPDSVHNAVSATGSLGLVDPVYSAGKYVLTGMANKGNEALDKMSRIGKVCMEPNPASRQI